MKLPISTFGGINQGDQEENLINRAYQGAQNSLVQRAPLEASDMINIDFTQGGIRKRKGSVEYKDFTNTGLNILVASDALISGIEWVDPATGSKIEVIVSKKTIYTNQSGTFAQVNAAGGSAYLHNSDVTKVSFAQTDGHLFIGIDGAGNYTQVYRSGGSLDDSLQTSSEYIDIDQDSASGAKNVYVTDESIFIEGQRISIDSGRSGEEYHYIDTISSGQLVVIDNLSNTHLAQVWTERSNPQHEICYGVTFGNNLFVAVGGGGAVPADAYIVTSPDGTTWTERVNPKDFILRSVVFGNGLFVAVGNPDGTDAYIVTSPDGTAWTERSNPKNIRLNGVTFGNGKFVAVGLRDGTDAYVITSADGVTWEQQSNPKFESLNDITFANNLFVAVGEPDTGSAYIITSADGVTWAQSSNPKTPALYGVAFGGGKFVAVGGVTGGQAYIITSADGDTWTQRSNPKNNILRNVVFGDNLFIAVGDSEGGGDAYIVVSTDGETWTERSNPKNITLQDITFANNLFVAVGELDGVDAYFITSPSAVLVRPANRYIEAFDTTVEHDITGAWDAASYIIESFQTRLLLSTGNTLVNYTPEAFTSSSGIWDMAGSTAGFLSAAGNTRSISAFAPLMSDSIQEALYIGTDAGFDVTTGFSVNDRLIRIEGARSPINHQSVAKALNWLVYLTDDKNIMAINKANVIDLGRRLKNFGGTGHLDVLSAAHSSVGAYGFYDKGKKQIIFSYSDDATHFNEHMAVIDMSLGEPVLGESQPSYEQRVRCLYWMIDSTADDWFSGIFQKTGATIGIFPTGFMYTRETTNLDLGNDNIDTTWEMPTFTGAAADRIKQWYWINGKLQAQTTGTPALTVAFRLDRVESNTGTGTWSLLDSSVKQISENLELYRRSETIKIIITSTDIYEWVIYNLNLKFDIGAELIT